MRPDAARDRSTYGDAQVKTKSIHTLILAACLLIAATAGAVAQDLVLYKGDQVDGKILTIGSWGSGKCEDIAKSGYTGSRSLKITARSLFEGGRIDFTQPVDLTQHFAKPNTYMQLIAKMQLDATGEDDPLLDAFYDPNASSRSSRTPVSRLRLVAKFDSGPAVECQVDVSGFKVGDDGWMPISFPLAKLKGHVKRDTYKLQRLIISGDGSEPFYIGQIHIITDTKPITADAGLPQFVSANDDVLFRAHTDGGAAALRYSWDFDAKDGIQEDALGEVVYHKFRRPTSSKNDSNLEFKVTLTVSDVFGIKQPVTSTVMITVF